MNKRKIGSKAEKLVANYLESQGCNILVLNYAIRGGEIDIVVCTPQKVIIFCEVKFRTSSRFGTIVDQLTYKKKARIKRTIMRFLHDYLPENYPNFRYTSIRFDFFAVEPSKTSVESHKITHYKNLPL